MKSDITPTGPVRLRSLRLPLHWPRRTARAHDDHLRVGRQVDRPRTPLIALINGGRGPS